MVQQRRRCGNLGLLMLASQMMQFGFHNIPPVTLALMGGQIAIFLEVFEKIFPSPHAVCMSSYLVIEHRAWRRMVLGTFYHADDMHLYYNMIALLYRGSQLEKKFGNVYFAYMIAIFTGMTSAVYVGLGYALTKFLENEEYNLSCAVGFSGVLFAMKVLTTEYSPENGRQYAMGIPVPSKYIYWAELILIQLITPNASFVGHLAGILVGLLYTKGPLKFLMDIFVRPGTAIHFQLSRPNRAGGRTPGGLWFGSRRLFGGGTPNNDGAGTSRANTDPTGARPGFFGRPATDTPAREYRYREDYDYNGRSDSEDNDGGQRSRPYHEYTGRRTEREQYDIAMQDSMRHGPNTRQQQQSPPPTNRSSDASLNNSHSQRLYPDLEDLRSRRRNFYQ